MSPWDRLELAPTSDTRAIKKAYARLLKQHRPDQDAAAFQQLHQAYKTALQLAEQQAEVAEAMPATTPPREPEPEQLANWSIQLTPASPPVAPAEPDPVPDYRPLFQRCRQLLAEHHGARQPQHWEFLARSPELLDDSLRHQLSHALFEELVRHQHDLDPWRSDLTQIEPAELNYLNQLFGWDSRRDELLYGPDTAIREHLFDLLDSHTAEQPVEQGLRGSKKLIRQKPQQQDEALDFYYFGSMLHRCIAVAIDLFAIGVVVDFLLQWSPLAARLDAGQLSNTRLLVTFSLYIPIAALLEHSRWQATPGKLLLGLRVTDTSMKPLRWRHTLMRAGCMVAVLALILINHYLEPKAGLLIMVLFVANCLMNGNLIQDFVSRTHVVNLRLSRRRHRQATA